MTENPNNLISRAVIEFLASTSASTTGASMSANVPQGLKVILKAISRELHKKAPDRLFTAVQIAIIARLAYGGSAMAPPEILGNVRAFGRYLQKYPNISGFTAEGSTGNRRTYKPHDTTLQKRFSLDS